MPWIVSLALGLLCAARLSSDLFQAKAATWFEGAAWVFSLGVPAAILVFGNSTWDGYHAVLTWLMAAAILPWGERHNPRRAHWRILGMVWVLLGNVIWITTSYLDNHRVAFYAGVLLNVGFLIVCKIWFRLPFLAVQASNTLLLVLLGVPLVDLVIRPSYRLDQQPDTAKQMYSYEAAKKDPAAFAQWWLYFIDEWNALGNHIFMPDPTGVLPFRVRPGSEANFFESRIVVNRLGFRGHEILADKGNSYRIVALGESTTFGCTLRATDKPWPQLLEEMIADRLKPSMPVEVINAGVPAHHLQHTLSRMQKEILPLKPDMLICYHGINGFNLLSDAMPRSYGELPPAYVRRPLKIVADCEYRLKMMIFRKRYVSKLVSQQPTFHEPLETAYARAYEQLIEIARTNDIQLVIANFSLAVNEHSSPDVIAFYRAGFPSVFWSMRANAAHGKLVEEISGQHTEVIYVDTHPQLDGEHEKFIDLMHFTQEGRQQLAETFFKAIERPLEQKLKR